MKTPTLPRVQTLTGRALARLMQGKRYTHRDFQNQTASYRLSSYIEHLRKTHDWVIETIPEEAPTNDPVGRTATYARYAIQPELLAEYRNLIGRERFDNFVEAVKKFEGGADDKL